MLGIVKPGGTIVLAASLAEGLGSPEFQESLHDYIARGEFNAGPRSVAPVADGVPIPGAAAHCAMDEWQLVMLKKVLGHCKVKVVSGAPFADTLRQCGVEPVATVEEAVAASLADYGPSAKLAVIPKGPYVLPYVAVSAPPQATLVSPTR